MPELTTEISIQEYHSISTGGISILFLIKGQLFNRVSVLETKELLWWFDKQTNRFATEEESEQLEAIVKNFLVGYKFKEINQLPSYATPI